MAKYLSELFSSVMLASLLRALAGVTVFCLASSCGHTLTVKSEPSGAQVFAVDAKGERAALLGQTPVSLQKPNERSFFALEVSRQGYAPKQILSPALSSGSTELSIRLQPLDNTYFVQQFASDRGRLINGAFSDLLKLQAAILAKQSAEIVALEKSMAGAFDGVSLYHSMLGNHYFLIGNTAEARKRFGRALVLDPGNAEAQEMMRFLAKVAPK